MRRRRRRSWFFLGAAVALWVFATTPERVAAQQGGVAGTVREEGTNAPLAAVLVEALGANGTIVGRTITGPSGTFRLNEMPAGSYTIRFTSPGWSTVNLPATAVTSSRVTSISVTMTERSYSLNPITVTASKTRRRSSTLRPPSRSFRRSTFRSVRRRRSPST